MQYIRFENESTIAIIDGTYYEMNAKAIIDNNNCLIPMDFATKIFEGVITFEIDTEENIIKINRIKTGINGNNEPVYEPLTFTLPSAKNTTNLAYEKFSILPLHRLFGSIHTTP